MAITPFEKDIEIIQKLDDEPNDVQGLTPEELKKRFDQAAIWLKEYINGTLIPAITGDGGTGGASNIGAAVDDFPGETVQEVLDAFNDALRQTGLVVKPGIFGAEMKIRLLNDGPVTLILDSNELF